VAEQSTTGRVAGWLASWASVIAPVTLVSTLLFYFGYVSSRAQYEYFGLDVDVVGLGTQDYVMRSPQPLLVPLLAFTLLGAAFLYGHTWLRQRARRAAAVAAIQDETPERAAARRTMRRLRLGMRIAVVAGLGLLAAGTVLLFAYAAVRDWQLYDLVTPLLTAAGGALASYGWRFTETTSQPAPDPATGGPPGTDDAALLRRAARVLLLALTAVSLFWVTATVAQLSGRGLARDTALHLDRLPRVILDTREPLFLRSPGVTETVLPAGQGQTYHYRYRQLRLLIMGRNTMFLVPETWSPSNSTLLVPANDSVRVQFQFQNQTPCRTLRDVTPQAGC
jgi:hypothetical protein